MNSEFHAAWESLSEIQRQAAEWRDEALMLLAGPGSGKTRVLTCRIARLLSSSLSDKFRVLALTFTNKAATEMRERIVAFSAEHEARAFVGTFHSFCADVLRQHGRQVGVRPNFTIFSQAEDLQAVLNDAVGRIRKRGTTLFDLDRKILPVIQRLKSLLVLPEEAPDHIQDSELRQRVKEVYAAYEAELQRRNALDFNSLILKTDQLFERLPMFSERYRTVYPYISIDEFQDTNEAQYRLIRALCGPDHRNVFVVADDDQIIYQWNGASHRRLEQFSQDYAPQVMQLPINYRCPSRVVTLANNLIRHNFLRSAGKKPTIAVQRASTERSVRVLHGFADFPAEVQAIGDDLEARFNGLPESVAVLARRRRLLEDAAAILSERGIRAMVAQRKDEFESPPVVWIHSMLRLANNRGSDEALEAVAGTFQQLAGIMTDPNQIAAEAKAANGDYLKQWLRTIEDRTNDAEVKRVVSEATRTLADTTDLLAFNTMAMEWLTRAVARVRESASQSESTFAGYEEEVETWNSLVSEIRRAYHRNLTLEAFLHELQMRSKEPPLKPQTIELMTIHVAKGKEFRHVYLIGTVDDEIPSFQSLKKGDKSPEMEEERRNCFVAITRTIETLTLSYARTYYGWGKRPSRFLREMGLTV